MTTPPLGYKRPTYPTTAAGLVRMLNAHTDYRWRTFMRDGRRAIERREYSLNHRAFWAFQGWATDRRDLARLAEEHGVV